MVDEGLKVGQLKISAYQEAVVPQYHSAPRPLSVHRTVIVFVQCWASVPPLPALSGFSATEGAQDTVLLHAHDPVRDCFANATSYPPRCSAPASLAFFLLVFGLPFSACAHSPRFGNFSNHPSSLTTCPTSK